MLSQARSVKDLLIVTFQGYTDLGSVSSCCYTAPPKVCAVEPKCVTEIFKVIIKI